MIRAKKYKPRKAPRMELFRKKSSDYSDNAYREAVTKLKYLLAESYTPVTVHKVSSTHFTTPQSTGALYKLNYNTPTYEPGQYSKRGLTSYTSGNDYRKSTEDSDLGSFVKRQENYIQQLEKESQSYRDELSKMLIKVKDMVTENQRLRDEPRITATGSGTEEESEFEEKPGKTQLCKHQCAGPNIVYESRISELEAQLTQSRIEMRKAQDEASYLRMQARPLDPNHLPMETNRQIEALQKEKNELNETVSNLQSLISQLRDKEAAATLKVKRSLDLIDQTHFEKNQLELEVRRLKSELDRMNDKQREIMQDSARRVNEAERRYALQIERLNGDLSTHWDTANRLNLELDKSKRTEQELRRELLQKSSVIEELKKELTTKTSNLQTEALTAGAERETLESELSSTRLAVERAERNGRAEVAKLQAEVSSLRQRLDRADVDLLHAKKENLRLSETSATLEKELDLLKSARNPTSASAREHTKNDDLAAMIKDMDTKHAQSVGDLEGMVQTQAQLMEKLKTECQLLTERLEASNARHKEEMAGLQSNVDYLNSKLEAPVNYENQEWRGDGMVSGYGDDTGQYDGSGQQNGGVHEGYNGQEAYQGQGYDDGSGYTAGEQSYPEGEQGYPTDEQGYPTEGDQAYPTGDQSYPADDQGYPTGDQSYPADDQGYPTGDQSYPADDQGYPTDQPYPVNGQGYPTGDQVYPPDNQSYPTTEGDQTYGPTDPQDYTEEIPPTEAYGATEQPSPIDVQPVTGIDTDGTSLVAQPEKYIPPPTQ